MPPLGGGADGDVAAQGEVAVDVAAAIAQVEGDDVGGRRVAAVLGVQPAHLGVVEQRERQVPGGDAGVPGRVDEAGFEPARGGRVDIVGVEVQVHGEAGGFTASGGTCGGGGGSGGGLWRGRPLARYGFRAGVRIGLGGAGERGRGGGRGCHGA